VLSMLPQDDSVLTASCPCSPRAPDIDAVTFVQRSPGVDALGGETRPN